MGYAFAAAALLQGYAAYRAGQSQAHILRKNAKLLEKAAEDRMRAGKEEAGLVREQGEIEEAVMVNELSASGVTVYGSPLQSIVTAVQTNLSEARSRVSLARLEADRMRDQAAILRSRARAATAGGYLGAIAGGISGAAAIYGASGGEDGGETNAES